MIRNYCVFNSILSRACYLKKNPASCIKTRSRDLENEAKGSRNRREHPIRQISPVLLSRGETEVHQRKNGQTMRIFVFYSTPRKRLMFHTRAEVSFFLFPFLFFFFSPSPPPLLLLVQSLETGNREPDCLLEEDTRCWPSFCKCARSRWHYRGESISRDISFCSSCKRKTDVTFLIPGFSSRSI